ncbi:MAG: aminotransferase class I/II-fold pyridoxal phosphate-dependent enzyme [Polyangiaceae bacterium]
MGIGDTTEALTPTIVKAMHERVERLANRETYTGYGDSEGEMPLREAIAADYEARGAAVNADEIFVSDGAKPDTGNIQSIFDENAIVAVQDPAYPVYVDTNVIAGRAGTYDAARGLYDRIVYMPCNEQNGFFPEVPKAKADLVYLCSPNNPTGNVATREQLEAFVAYARKHRAVIFFDAAYRDYIRNPKLPRSIYEIRGREGLRHRVLQFLQGRWFHRGSPGLGRHSQVPRARRRRTG